MSMAPTNKVNAGGMTTLLAVVIAWASDEFLRVQVPTEVGIAISGIVIYVVQYLVADRR